MAPSSPSPSDDPAPPTATATANNGSPGSVRLKGFAAGTASGLTKLVVGHPFDVIKVRPSLSRSLSYDVVREDGDADGGGRGIGETSMRRGGNV